MQLQTLVIELTSKCNLRCKHCYIGDTKNHDLPIEIINNVVEQAKQLGVEKIILTGGEPFLRDDLVEIIQTISNVIKPSISTNGTIYKQIPSDKVYDIQVSLDGLEKNHNWLRGEEVYELTIENIKRFKEDGHKITINTTLFNKNVNDIPPLLELAIKLGVDGYRVISLVPIGYGRSLEPSSLDGLKKVTNFLLSKRIEYEGIIQIGLPQYYLQLIKEETGKITECIAGYSKVYVSSTGDVFPCEFLRTKIGDVSNLSNLLRKREYNSQICPCMGGDICGM